MMERIAIIGGGASGLVAAITAARAGADVTLFEKKDKLAAKIYATGNGRCNICNLHFDARTCYYSSDKLYTDRLNSLHDFFSEIQLIHFFEELGVFFHDVDGYVYPRTEQASVIPAVLERELHRLHVRIITNCTVTEMKPNGSDSVAIVYQSERMQEETFRKVIVCTGGKSASIFGSTGDAYAFADRLGIKVTSLYPGLVPLKVKEHFPKLLQGVRADAAIQLFADGDRIGAARGEVQFTKDYLSGIPIFQVSRDVLKSLSENKKTELIVNFVPDSNFSPSSSLRESEFERRLSLSNDGTLLTFAQGIVHPGIASLAAERMGLTLENKTRKLTKTQLRTFYDSLFAMSFTPTGSAGFEKSQVTAGGISLSEVDDTFASVRYPNIYFAGEALDIDGICGGYNLYFAMASGMKASVSAVTPEN